MAWGSKYVACAWGHCSAGEVVDDEGPVDALHALNTVKNTILGQNSGSLRKDYS